MSHHQTFKLCLVVVVLAVMLANSESLSYGITGCQPQTPCPCAADGVCRPKRDTWGHYKTRWRTWPGESRDESPTLADTPIQEDEQTLPPLETPIPEQEDLRGPYKEKKDRTKEIGEEGSVIENPEQLLPGPEDVPVFDPQGNQLQQLPPTEDAPPQLPKSLQQAAVLMNQHSTGQAQAAPISATPSIQQTGWQQPALGLVNPALTVVTTPDSLQQAIYFEATDKSTAADE